MDTTRVEFIGKQIDKVVESARTHPIGLTPEKVALIAAATGFIAAIIPQLLIFYLNKTKEKRNKIKELIADERRIAILLTKYYKELVMHKVHKTYWYRTAEIYDPDKKDIEDSIKRHFMSNQRSFKTISKIDEATSEYFKIVTHYMILTKRNKIIDEILVNINSFEPRKASRFNEILSYHELWSVAVPREEKALNEEYLYYSKCFDRIHNEMIK